MLKNENQRPPVLSTANNYPDKSLTGFSLDLQMVNRVKVTEVASLLALLQLVLVQDFLGTWTGASCPRFVQRSSGSLFKGAAHLPTPATGFICHPNLKKISPSNKSLYVTQIEKRFLHQIKVYMSPKSKKYIFIE